MSPTCGGGGIAVWVRGQSSVSPTCGGGGSVVIGVEVVQVVHALLILTTPGAVLAVVMGVTGGIIVVGYRMAHRQSLSENHSNG